MFRRNRLRFVAVMVPLLLSSGCGWVDSAGSNTNNELPVLSLSADASTLAPLPPGNDEELDPADDDPAAGAADDAGSDARPLVLAVLEEASITVEADASDRDGSIAAFEWNESPLAEGALSACGAVDGFDLERAAPTLTAACTEPGCAPVFEQVAADPPADADEEAGQGSNPASVRFEIELPALRAPVGATYELGVSDEDGGQGVAAVTFCLVSVNEAPEAVDDSFSILEGSVLEITADTLNLLSNDVDDIDNANEPLQVLVDPVRPPLAATVFELGDDGGFTYAFTGASLDSDIVDSFDYAVTDGLFTSTATATVRVVQRDDPPELVEPLPALEAIEGIAFEAELAPFFSDPEGADLAFDILAGELPPSGELSLSTIGVLAGTPADGDAGEYSLTLAASDGSLTAEADLTLDVLDNEPVVVRAIPRQLVNAGERVRFGVARYFTDPESATLQFRLSARGTGLNLTINTRSGIITGVVGDAGRYELIVSASDGFNVPATGTVDLVVAE